MQSGRTEIATGLARREPLRAPFAHRIRLNELQLKLRAVPSMATYTHDDLRADRLNGRSAPPDLPTSSGSFQIGCKDRKSTRLNSSHSQISYAVFCLKKKK